MGEGAEQEEAAMLRRALAESMKRINLLNSDSSAMVDRRIVVKLLVTFFERKQSREVLALMSRMLGFTGEPPPSLPSRLDCPFTSIAASCLWWSSPCAVHFKDTWAPRPCYFHRQKTSLRKSRYIAVARDFN